MNNNDNRHYFNALKEEELYEKASFIVNNNLISVSFDDEKGGLTKNEAINFIKKHYLNVDIEKINLVRLNTNLM